jgi:hypothetical protein
MELLYDTATKHHYCLLITRSVCQTQHVTVIKLQMSKIPPYLVKCPKKIILKTLMSEQVNEIV